MRTLAKTLRIYIVPGCVFQSVMVGGGYGTGRELVEYFTEYGFWGGVLGIGVALILMAVVLACTFEFARLHRHYDYKTFVRGLLGPFSVVFEVTALTMLLLILAVIAAAASAIFVDYFALPAWIGLLSLTAVIGVLSFFGRDVLAMTLAVWSLVLYAVFIVFFIVVLSRGAGDIFAHAQGWSVTGGWFVSGLKYGFYNLAIAPLILYTVRPIDSRRQAVGAGVIAAVIALVPGLIFHVAFFAGYPGVLEQAVPVYWMIQKFYMPGFLTVYTIMLLGTFIETGAGTLRGVLDRIEAAFLARGKTPPSPRANGLIAMCAIGVSVALSNLGVIALVEKGYGTMAWVYLAVFVGPLLTIGLYTILKSPQAAAE